MLLNFSRFDPRSVRPPTRSGKQHPPHHRRHKREEARGDGPRPHAGTRRSRARLGALRVLRERRHLPVDVLHLALVVADLDASRRILRHQLAKQFRKRRAFWRFRNRLPGRAFRNLQALRSHFRKLRPQPHPPLIDATHAHAPTAHRSAGEVLSERLLALSQPAHRFRQGHPFRAFRMFRFHTRNVGRSARLQYFAKIYIRNRLQTSRLRV